MSPSLVSESASSRFPRKILLNDEGNSALHYVDLGAPDRNWTYQGAGRDLQLIGNNLVLRSRPQGYVELDLTHGGAVVRDVVVANLPGNVESARRLPNGNTIIAGNGGGGIFVWEVDTANVAVPRRAKLFVGIDKVRMLRLTDDGTFLFCSDTGGKRIIHEGAWDHGLETLFDVPEGVPADSMVKAVRLAPHVVMVSTGYAASLLRIDTKKKQVLQTIGGKSQPEPGTGKRPLSPFFFSGYQMLANGDSLVCNWQGHSTGHNGQGYQVLQYDREGSLIWFFDQTTHPMMASLNNIIAIDGLDTEKLHDERSGAVVPV